jgi:hypothetical protein
MLALRKAPLAVLARLEVTGVAAVVAALSISVGIWMWRTWNTAYGLTDRRLLMAVGPKREKMRTLALGELDPVRIVLRTRAGKLLLFAKVLLFCLSGTTCIPNRQRPPIWKFLEAGERTRREAPCGM